VVSTPRSLTTPSSSSAERLRAMSLIPSFVVLCSCLKLHVQKASAVVSLWRQAPRFGSRSHVGVHGR
jgi:hypothetical protein